MKRINVNNVEVLGRLIPNSGKIHQNQEVYNIRGRRSICTIKAVHYKDPPKILVGCKTENEQDCIIGDEKVIEKDSNVGYRIRKLTPRECWRLMGFSDEDFDRAVKAGVSNTQLYKQAGNSIVTNVLYYIFKELYEAMPYLFDDLKVSSYFSGIGAFEIALNRLFNDINGTPTKSSEFSEKKEGGYSYCL